MDNAVVRGTVLRSDVIDVPNDLGHQLRRLVAGARLCLERHSARMKADPEYREVVEYLATLLSERPGRMGQTPRIAAAGHALLIKVL